jgi:hypothetical protein
MRTNSILTVIALALASTGAAYYMLRDHALPRPVDAAKPSRSSTASLPVKNPSLPDERRDPPVNPEQQRLTRMSEKIAALEVRLRDLEATAHEPATDQAGSRPDEPTASEGAEEAKAKELSPDAFAQRLDAALAGDFDGEATRGTLEEMATSLAAVPGTHLADLQCGEQFCRARFVSDNGEPPNIEQVVGASPFMESGFTLTEPDGSASVYFTQLGQSLDELHREAQESALRDVHP